MKYFTNRCIFFFFCLAILFANKIQAQSNLLWYEDPEKLSPTGTSYILYSDFLDNGNLAITMTVDNATYLFGDSIPVSTGIHLLYYDNQNKITKAVAFNHSTGTVDFAEQQVSSNNYTYIHLLSLHGSWCFNGIDTINYPNPNNNNEQALIAYDSSGNYVNHLTYSTALSSSTLKGYDQMGNPIVVWHSNVGSYSYFTVYSKDLSQILYNYNWNTGTQLGTPAQVIENVIPISNNRYVLYGRSPAALDIDPTNSTYLLGNQTNTNGIYYALCDSSFHVIYGSYMPDGITNIRDIVFYQDNLLLFGNYEDSIVINTVNGPAVLPYPNLTAMGYYFIKSDTLLNFEWAKYVACYNTVSLYNIPNSVKNRNSSKFSFNINSNDTTYITTNLNLGRNYFGGTSIFQMDNLGNTKYFGSFEKHWSFDFMIGKTMLDDSTLFTNNQMCFRMDISLNDIPHWLRRPDSSNCGFVMAKYRLKYVNTHSLTGTIIGDLNSNYQVDSSDVYIKGIPVLSILDTNIVLSQNNGEYSVPTDTGLYTVTASNISNFNSCYPQYQYATFADTSQSDTGNVFFYTPENIIYDLSISGVTSSSIRPFTPFPTTINISNKGTVTTGATVKIAFDSIKCTFISADVNPIFNSPDSLLFNLPPVKPFESVQIKIILSCDTILTIGDTIPIFASAIPINGTENYPLDNVDSLRGLFSNSADPNEKQSTLPEFYSIYDVDSTLAFNYKILFQNTGNATAIKVFLIDTLDTKLDILTLSNFHSSHPFTASLLYNRILKIEFNNINLLDSGTNLIESQGFFSYSIQPKFPVQLNEQISNRANIFFDYNEPVLTNQTTTTFVNNVGINELKSSINFNIYPNPTSEFIILETAVSTAKFGLKYQITDQVGKVILPPTTTKDSEIKINVSKLKAGMYFVSIISNEGIKSTKKFIKY